MTNEETTAPKAETVGSWGELSDEGRKWFLAGDITEGAITASDMSRAWKVLAVFRDIALAQQPVPDFDRAVGYSHIMGDMATMLSSTGWPVPDKNGVDYHFIDPRDLEDLQEFQRDQDEPDDDGTEHDRAAAGA